MSKTALVIGVGNIGFRHAQAVAALPELSEIFLVESAATRHEFLVSAIADGAFGKKSAVLFSSIEEFTATGRKPSLVISAVTSKRQLAIMSHLSGWYAAGIPVLLEKPIASGPLSLRIMADTLPAALVNTPRSMWPGYVQLKERLHGLTKGGLKLELSVSGGAWGLGCNGVHFVHLFRFLTSSARLDLVHSDLSVADSGNKRGSDYREYVGSATWVNQRGDRLTLTSLAEPSAAMDMVCKAQDGSVHFDLSEDRGNVLGADGSLVQELKPMYVSQSTTEIAARVFSGRQTGLPTVAESAADHEAIFAALEKSIGRMDDYGIT